MDTLYTFLENTTHYKTKCVNFSGLMNSATKLKFFSLVFVFTAWGLGLRALQGFAVQGFVSRVFICG